MHGVGVMRCVIYPADDDRDSGLPSLQDVMIHGGEKKPIVFILFRGIGEKCNQGVLTKKNLAYSLSL